MYGNNRHKSNDPIPGIWYTRCSLIYRTNYNIVQVHYNIIFRYCDIIDIESQFREGLVF